MSFPPFPDAGSAKFKQGRRPARSVSLVLGNRQPAVIGFLRPPLPCTSSPTLSTASQAPFKGGNDNTCGQG